MLKHFYAFMRCFSRHIHIEVWHKHFMEGLFCMYESADAIPVVTWRVHLKWKGRYVWMKEESESFFSKRKIEQSFLTAKTDEQTEANVILNQTFTLHTSAKMFQHATDSYKVADKHVLKVVLLRGVDFTSLTKKRRRKKEKSVMQPHLSRASLKFFLGMSNWNTVLSQSVEALSLPPCFLRKASKPFSEGYFSLPMNTTENTMAKKKMKKKTDGGGGWDQNKSAWTPPLHPPKKERNGFVDTDGSSNCRTGSTVCPAASRSLSLLFINSRNRYL